VPESVKLVRILEEVARRHPFVKFIKMAAVCLSMGFFGMYENRFTTLNDTIMTLFQLMFGKFYY
jgi:hypothetical protein